MSICAFERIDLYDKFTETQLFISYAKPHKPMTSSTLARWMLDALKQSLIDVDKSKAFYKRKTKYHLKLPGYIYLPNN